MRLNNTYKVVLRMASCLTMAAMSFSCITFDQDFSPAEDKVHDYPVKVNAVQEAMTRISADGNVLSWDEEDQIQIAAVMPGIEVSDTAATSVLTRFRSIDSDPAKASFTGFVSLLSEPHTCYFTYPVGEALKVDPVEETIITNYTSQDGSHRPFLYGRSDYDKEGMDVVMKHVGAVLELTVTTPGVTKVSFIGNKLESLSPIVINTSNETVALPNEAVRQLTVNVQQNGKTYLFVPPVALEEGFTLICSNDDGSRYFMKSYTDGASDGYDFSGKRGARIPVTIGGEFTEFAVSASDLNIVHTRNLQGLLTGTKATFRMSKTGTSNKLIEGWGATLTDASGNVVRSYSSTGAITGGECTLEVVDNRIFLEEGTYTLTPYYIMYGERKTFDVASLPKKEVGDPGIVLTIGGATSYDKYADNNSATDPNTHTNTLLEGLTVSTNVAEDVIKQYSAALVGNDGNAIAIGTPTPAVQNSNNVRTYGNKTCSKKQSYTMSVNFMVGHIPMNASRVFYITGLPYEVNFSSDDNSWTKLGIAEHSDSRITFKGLGEWSTKNGAIVSPAFYLPDNSLNVKTSVDACYKGERYVYIEPVAADCQTITMGQSSVKTNVPDKSWGIYKDLSSKGYVNCSTTFTLNNEKPSLIYASNAQAGYNLAIYKIKIQYANQ